MSDETERDGAQEREFVRASGHPDEAFADRKERMRKASKAVDAATPRKRKRRGGDDERELCI